MSLRESLIECGVSAEDAESMLARLSDDDQGVQQHAYQQTLRALTPVLLRTLAELAKQERSK